MRALTKFGIGILLFVFISHNEIISQNTPSQATHLMSVSEGITAPYGVAAFEALKNANILDDIKKKIIYAESITQTVVYAITAANIGMVAKSSLYSPKLKKYHENVHWIEVDKTLYNPIRQGIVILKKAKDNKEVKAFYNFILSEKGKNILKKYGYLIP